MPEDTEARVVSDYKLVPKSHYHKIGLTFLGVTFLVGLFYAGYVYYAAPTLLETQLWEQLEAKISELEVNPPPFDFVVVPDALETITMPSPLNRSIDELRNEFSVAQQNIVLPEGEPASIFDIPVGDVTYLEYINSLPVGLQEPIFQMHDELLVLTRSLGERYQQTTLAERVGRPGDLVYAEYIHTKAMQPLVYPSVRVVEAAYIATVLSTQFPSDARFYQEYVDTYIADGVGYGYYTEQEANMAEMMVYDYLAAAAKNDIAKQVLQSLE